jgi:hypothetical protein
VSRDGDGQQLTKRPRNDGESGSSSSSTLSSSSFHGSSSSSSSSSSAAAAHGPAAFLAALAGPAPPAGGSAVSSASLTLGTNPGFRPVAGFQPTATGFQPPGATVARAVAITGRLYQPPAPPPPLRPASMGRGHLRVATYNTDGIWERCLVAERATAASDAIVDAGPDVVLLQELVRA